jgi:hypothetical protein
VLPAGGLAEPLWKVQAVRSYVGGDSFRLQEHRDGSTGRRRSYQELIDLIDTSDPAWPVIASVLREMADAEVEIDKAALLIAVKLGRGRFTMLDDVRPPNRKLDYDPPASGRGSIVYYIRRSEVIKIGTTVAPMSRFDDLMPDEILAFEPGGAAKETLRHRQFAHLRRRGEHFTQAPELAEHIRRIREQHGPPDPAWPTVASLGQSPDVRHHLPALASEDKITVAQASRELGIRKATLYGWARRGRISVAGYSDQGQQTYYVEHLVTLRDDSRLARLA